MNEYEGLNLPQLLDLLQPLSLADPVSWLPRTPGWWVVAVWLLAVGLVGGWRQHQHTRRNRYRRAALDKLTQLESRAADDAGIGREIGELLKRTAIAAYPRSEVAKLSGAEWAAFLRRTTNPDTLIDGAADRLARAPYREDPAVHELLDPARRWIKAHRA